MSRARDAVAAATLRRDGDRVVVAGALLRSGIATLWPRVTGPLLAGAACLDLGEVDSFDSAGVAFLAELAARGRPDPLRVERHPPGLVELASAYRMSPALAFAS